MNNELTLEEWIETVDGSPDLSPEQKADLFRNVFRDAPIDFLLDAYSTVLLGEETMPSVPWRNLRLFIEGEILRRTDDKNMAKA